MRKYLVEIEVVLDDNGYLLEKNWIAQAIADQLEEGEEVLKYRVTEEEV